MVNMVRDGKKVAPTCEECGCRLKITHAKETIWGKGVSLLSHFEGAPYGRDARGCICTEIDTYYVNNNGKLSVHFMY